MFKGLSNSLSNKDNNKSNNNNNFSMMQSKSSEELKRHSSSNSISSGTGVMKMTDASLINDSFCGFDDSMKLSSGHKSVTNVNESNQLGQCQSLGAVRSLSDPNAKGNASYDIDDLDDATFAARGVIHRGVAKVMPTANAFGMGSMGSMGSMDDLDDFGGMGGAALSLSSMSLSGKSPLQQRSMGMQSMQQPMGLGLQSNELKTVPLKSFSSAPVSLQAQTITSPPAKVTHNKLQSMPEMPPMAMGFAPPAKVQGFPEPASKVNDSLDIFMPPPKVLGSDSSSDDCGMKSPRKDDGCCVKPHYYNEYTTCTMANKPCDVLDGIAKICEKYGDEKDGDKEMEYVVDSKEFAIEGTAYVKHKPLRFVISVWHDSEENNDLTRVEFQKRRGDSMLFQQFWSEMLECIHSCKAFKNVSGAIRCQDFESFFMPSFDLEDDYQFSKNDLDNMAADLCEDYRDEAIDVLATLCDEMGSVSFCELVSNHSDLINALVKDTLSHYDACHVRGGLCALSKLVQSGVKCIDNLIAQTSIMCQLVLLVNHESQLIQKRAVQLMSQLSSSSSNWNLNAKMCGDVKDKLMELSGDANGNLKEMLNNISSKIDADQMKQ